MLSVAGDLKVLFHFLKYGSTLNLSLVSFNHTELHCIFICIPRQLFISFHINMDQVWVNMCRSANRRQYLYTKEKHSDFMRLLMLSILWCTVFFIINDRQMHESRSAWNIHEQRQQQRKQSTRTHTHTYIFGSYEVSAQHALATKTQQSVKRRNCMKWIVYTNTHLWRLTHPHLL